MTIQSPSHGLETGIAKLEMSLPFPHLEASLSSAEANYYGKDLSALTLNKIQGNLQNTYVKTYIEECSVSGVPNVATWRNHGKPTM